MNPKLKSKSNAELMKHREESKAAAREILDRAKKEDRDMTATENAAFEALANQSDEAVAELDARQANADRSAGIHQLNGGRPTPTRIDASSPLSRGNVGQRGGLWLTRDGQPVTVLAKGEPMAHGGSSFGGDDESGLSLGNFIRSIVTGNRAFAEREHEFMAAVDLGGSAATGGVMVPAQLFSQVIDQSRANAVVMQAGALTIPMTTAALSIARVATDPTFETKEQNAAFTGSTVVFDAINLNARTIGTVITMSAELAADAPNAGQLIDQVLQAALAAEIDRLAIQGVAGQPTGIINAAGTQETTSVGAIAWEDYAAAVEALELINAAPNAYIVNPAIKKDLSLLTTGDGTNSAKNWLPAPDGVSQLSRYSTTNCPLASSIVGDFTKLAFGVRESAQVQVSNVSGDSFKKNQIQVRVTWRGDVALIRPSHFHILRGITS